MAIPTEGPSQVDDHKLSTIGSVAELLRFSCSRYRAYCLYFQAPPRSDVDETGLGVAWRQVSKDDWQTVTEIEAMLNQLGQFGLENKPPYCHRVVQFAVSAPADDLNERVQPKMFGA